MLTKTSLNAVQALLYLALRDHKHPIAPGELAKELGASTTYLSKVNTQLAKAGIVQAHRGTRGGVTLARRPEDITLRAVVEACQGQILGDYCAPHDDLDQVCAFHAAMRELQEAIISALDNWTIADLVKKPLPVPAIRGQVNCLMARAGHQDDCTRA